MGRLLCGTAFDLLGCLYLDIKEELNISLRRVCQSFWSKLNPAAGSRAPVFGVEAQRSRSRPSSGPSTPRGSPPVAPADGSEQGDGRKRGREAEPTASRFVAQESMVWPEWRRGYPMLALH